MVYADLLRKRLFSLSERSQGLRNGDPVGLNIYLLTNNTGL